MPPSYFDGCDRHPMNWIAPEKEERRLFCFGCEAIKFVKGLGTTIWTTSGDGEMVLPPGVEVWIRYGKSKIIW